MKTVKVRRTRQAGHCWRSRDEFISDVLISTPSHGHAKAGRPARTCIQQLREDTGCSPECYIIAEGVVNDIMPGSDGLGFLGILKKSSELRFGPRRIQLFAAGCTRVGWVSKLRADAGPTVSIVKIVSLSLLVSKNLKVKKVIKVSYLNQESRQCFGIPYVHFTYPYILNILHEDLPEAMNDKEEWRERIRDIRAGSTRW